MITVTNPTDKEIKIVYLGTEYKVGATNTTVVEEDVATYWKGIHEFLKLTDTKAVKEEAEKKEEKTKK